MRPPVAAGWMLAAVALVALVVTLSGEDGRLVRAEFTSARGLLEGNEVRIRGAPAGSVRTIALTERDTALVTIRLDDDVPDPRADATAAIRPVDLLGDVYLAFDPGTDPEPLRGAIRTARTSNAPRLDELLRAFAPEARDGLRALVVALGQGFDRRGDDAHEAVLHLRPALEATDALMRELDDQRASLRELVEDGERATRQVSARRGDLGTTVDELGATLRAVADRSGALARTLRDAPALLSRLTGTSRRLATTARSAIPLARALGETAPDLAVAAAELPAFARDAGEAIDDARPLVTDLGATLEVARPAAPRLAEGLGALASAAPSLDRLTRALVPAARPISEGFFVNFADQAAEPGTQPFDPFADPTRRYWRGAAVFSCETFGMPVERGCLDRYLGRAKTGDRRRRRAAVPRPTAPARPAPAAPQTPRPPAAPDLPDLPDLPLDLDGTVGEILGDVVDGAADLGRAPDGPEGLLDYLLRP